MGKPTMCIGENKGADQLRSNCEADQHLCFPYTNSIIPLLLKSEISRFYPSSVTVQAGLYWTRSESQIVGFLMHRLICLILVSSIVHKIYLNCEKYSIVKNYTLGINLFNALNKNLYCPIIHDYLSYICRQE